MSAMANGLICNEILTNQVWKHIWSLGEITQLLLNMEERHNSKQQ